jgi:hypothetical protein|nr:MAG TPA_asm: hypothetical protein [Caudoviricetes sp.]
MNFESAIVEAMNLQDLNDYINNRKPEELQTLIALAQKRINQLDQEKEAKYMAAIIKSVQDYLDNVGDLTFHVEYEDEDGQDAETDITVDNLNPPAGGNGVIYI